MHMTEDRDIFADCIHEAFRFNPKKRHVSRFSSNSLVMTIAEHSKHEIVISEKGPLFKVGHIDVIFIKLPDASSLNHIKMIDFISITHDFFVHLHRIELL